MLIAIVAAFVVADAPSTTATPTPLREIVYNVTQSQSGSGMAESFGGHAGGTIPDAGTSFGHGRGLITIDVLSAIKDSLLVRVTEVWNANGRPVSTVGIVAPDGSLRFPPSTVSDSVRSILPFFGPAFAAQKTLDVGSAWTVNVAANRVAATTKYSVSGISGAIVTLSETESVRPTAGLGLSVRTTGTVNYKPSRLVPISGDITKRTSESDASSYSEYTLRIHFERSSDTRDQ